MMHYAALDERINAGWPAYEAALKANSVKYEVFIYPGTQHGFHNDTTPRYDEAAAKLAWSRTIAFFKENLKGERRPHLSRAGRPRAMSDRLPPPPPFAGIFPIAPTPFTASGELDVDGQRRVLDCMIDQGVDGICILANYSEQFLLTDDERATLLDLCLAHVGGPRAGHRDLQPFQHAHRRRAGARRGGGRRRDADADAALPRRHAARRREGHARAFRAGGRGLPASRSWCRTRR